MKEATIIINGWHLSEAEAMTLRVALASANFDCGDDRDGREMAGNYRRHAARIMALVVGPQGRVRTA